MFLRFTITQTNQESHQPQGLFLTAYALLKAEDLNEGEQEQLRECLNWFKENLPIPRRPEIQDRAIFWYRDSAKECIGRMWELANILRSHGYDIQLQTCKRLGNVVYNDEYQIAAYPHWRDATIITR